MSTKTGIEWTDATWNPVTGCSKVRQGCKNCYAERDWARLSAPRPQPNIYTGRAFTDVACHPERLAEPLHWAIPRRIFVNSMSDLFHEAVPDDFIEKVLTITAHAPNHTFQILTKRPHRMRELMRRWTDMNGRPQPNLWLGVSVEDQAAADDRIPLLLATPAAVRWISAEPLLGPIRLDKPNPRPSRYDEAGRGIEWVEEATWLWKPGIDWVVVGGESGPKARPMHIDWARSLMLQCKAAGVAFHMKQLGAQPRGWCAAQVHTEPADRKDGACDFYEGHELREPCQGRCMAMVDKKGGNMDEWPEDLRVREYPQ